jgi:hypothetical protein
VALDPQIAMGIQIPKPADPIQTMNQMESVRALRDQREALAEERQQQAQALIEKSKNQAALNAALQANGGDYDLAGESLAKAGQNAAAQQAYAFATDRRKKMADALKAENDNAQAHLNLGMSILSTMGDTPQGYAAGRQAAKGLVANDPQIGPYFDQFFPENPDPSQIPDIVKRATGILTTAKERADAQAKEHDLFLSGKYDQGFAPTFAQTPPEGRQQALDVASHMIADPDTKRAFVQRWSGLLNASPDDILKAGMTPSEQASEAARAETAAETAKRDAETAKYHGVMAGIAQQRANQAGAATVGGQPNDAVLQYADQMKNGDIKIGDVPAAGGMRNAVQDYMHKQGFDLTQPLTSQVRARYEFASSILPQIDEVESLAKQIDAQGLMGSFSGRMRDSASAESAAASLQNLTPEQRQLVGRFATQADLLATGTAMAHFGARGAASAVGSMKKDLTAGGKDIDTFLGNLQAARSVLQGYANELKKGGGAKDPLGLGAPPKKGGGSGD